MSARLSALGFLLSLGFGSLLAFLVLPAPKITPIAVTVVYAADGATCYVYPDHGLSCLPPAKGTP